VRSASARPPTRLASHRNRRRTFEPTTHDWLTLIVTANLKREAEEDWGAEADVLAQPRQITGAHPFSRSSVVVSAVLLGAIVLYAATGWLWLVVHEGLH